MNNNYNNQPFNTTPPNPYPPIQQPVQAQPEVVSVQPNNGINKPLLLIAIVLCAISSIGLWYFTTMDNKKEEGPATTTTTTATTTKTTTTEKRLNLLTFKEFALVADNIVLAVQTGFTYDSALGNLNHPGVYIYDVIDDLDLTESLLRGIRGFVVADSTNPDHTKYTLYISNGSLQAIGYDAELIDSIENHLNTFNNTQEIYTQDNKQLCSYYLNRHNTGKTSCYNRKNEEIK